MTDARCDHATLQVSGWSSLIRVRQSGWRSWSGVTTFDMDWRGNYGADIRIQWWNSRRMIGWRAHRLSVFAFYDQYNVGSLRAAFLLLQVHQLLIRRPDHASAFDQFARALRNAADANGDHHDTRHGGRELPRA